MNDYKKYSLSIRLIHWVMALLIAIQFVTILYAKVMGEEGSLTFLMIQLHHASGILVLLFLILRVVARNIGKYPELPATYFSKREQMHAKVGQYLLYILMLFMPVTGYIIMDSSPYNVHFFQFAMPDIMQEKESTMNVVMELHEIGAWVIGFFVLGHIAFVIKHHFAKRGARLVRRML
ncbi:cytochrome b [Zooshikella sp. RANM57]|uniref:cytochrome b n=1 Tax=Zooshikella sp. RANM57 TaxID=3425863 RepID=UPI003D6F57FC